MSNNSRRSWVKTAAIAAIVVVVIHKSGVLHKV